MSFCVGDILNPVTLQGAGCHTCARILTLAPSAPMFERVNFDGVDMVIRSEDKKDENNILLMMILEEYKRVWKKSDTHIIFDWYSPSALNLLSVPLLTEQKTHRNSEEYKLTLERIRRFSNDHSPTVSEGPPSPMEKTVEKVENNIRSIFPFGPTPSKIAPMSHSIDTIPSLSSKDKASNASIREYVSMIKTLKTQKSFQLNQTMEKDLANISRKPNKFKQIVQKLSLALKAKLGVTQVIDSDTDTEAEDASDTEDNGNHEQSWPMHSDDHDFSNQHPRGNCRFAAGYTIPKPFVASLYSMAYYTPGFLELIEALLNPAE
jgi:hypothetical protein